MEKSLIEKSRKYEIQTRTISAITKLIFQFTLILLTLYAVVYFVPVKPFFKTIVHHCFWTLLCIYIVFVIIRQVKLNKFWSINDKIEEDYSKPGNEDKYYSRIIASYED